MNYCYSGLIVFFELLQLSIKLVLYLKITIRDNCGFEQRL